MAHANPVGGQTQYIDENIDVPEDTLDPAGFATTIRFVGPGGIMEFLDPDTA